MWYTQVGYRLSGILLEIGFLWPEFAKQITNEIFNGFFTEARIIREDNPEMFYGF
jgi:hypothetical protein